MKRRAPAAALILLAAYVVFGLVVRARHPRPTFSGGGAIAGAVHVHTERSHDGRGTIEEIAAAARGAGLRFIVLADHNVAAPPPAYVGGVLVVGGAELSTPFGHVLAVGPWPGGALARAVVEQVHAAGARAVLAHPFQKKRPWTGWDSETDWDGIEIVSFDSLWRSALARPWRLLPALLAFPWAPERALAELWDRDEQALRRWQQHPAAGLCAVDAHTLHARLFALLATYVPVELTGDAATDAARVTGALFTRSWCALRLLGDAWDPPKERVVRGRLRGLLWGEREVPWIYANVGH